MAENKTDYDINKELSTEAERAIAFSRVTYEGLGKREVFQQAVIRLLVIAVKLLARINSKI